MAYVYLHSDLTNNIPFYVGIGSDTKYLRAFSKKRRSKFWKDFTSKKAYKVEILYDELSWIEACKKEIELIKLYGRRNKNTGTLVNITDGGEGVNGYRHSLERLQIISKNSSLGKNGNARKCIHFDTLKEFNSLKEGCLHFNLKYSSQCSAIRDRQSTAQFYFKNKYFKRPSKEDISKKLSDLRKRK